MGDSIEDFLLCNEVEIETKTETETEIEKKNFTEKSKFDITYILSISFDEKPNFDDVELLGYQLTITDHLRKVFRNYNEKSNKQNPFNSVQILYATMQDLLKIVNNKKG